MNESHLRSILKGVSWRIIGTFDTVIISFFLTGHLETALKIGATELITKVALYYLHERCWLVFVDTAHQTKLISFFKAFTWRVVGTIDTMLLGWFYSGNPLTGIKIGFTEVITKIVLYYLHERAWHRLPLGTVRKWFGIKNKQE